MLTAVIQYGRGEEPAAKWFPKRDEWPALIEAQQKLDAQNGVYVKQLEASDRQVFEPSPKLKEPKTPDIAVDFRGMPEENPAILARKILQTPNFLDKALELDPKQVMELSSLCGLLSTALSMELEAKNSTAPKAVESSIPLIEQKIAAKTRMRV